MSSLSLLTVSVILDAYRKSTYCWQSSPERDCKKAWQHTSTNLVQIRHASRNHCFNWYNVQPAYGRGLNGCRCKTRWIRCYSYWESHENIVVDTLMMSSPEEIKFSLSSRIMESTPHTYILTLIQDQIKWSFDLSPNIYWTDFTNGVQKYGEKHLTCEPCSISILIMIWGSIKKIISP